MLKKYFRIFGIFSLLVKWGACTEEWRGGNKASEIMGRNKFNQKEVDQIRKLLRLKCAGTRFQQKMVRHKLRVDYEFNISDFNVQGKAFGPEEFDAALQRGAILVLDDATIEAMKAKRARDKARDAELAQQEAIASGEQTDWEEALRQWNALQEEGNE